MKPVVVNANPELEQLLLQLTYDDAWVILGCLTMWLAQGSTAEAGPLGVVTAAVAEAIIEQLQPIVAPHGSPRAALLAALAHPEAFDHGPTA
jgi:hypothetical protein